MIDTFSIKNFHAICDEIAGNDKELGQIIIEHGYPPMWSRPNTFETLVHIILEQQVSLASALSALKKLQEKTGKLTPQSILALTDEELKACYVSRQKTIYIKGLATEIENGNLNLDAFSKLPDNDIRKKLTSLKGIGNWTTDVYLMFVLQRADVFPVGDLAAVNALKRAKNLANDVSLAELIEITAQWKPYRTIATMILWHHYLSLPIRQIKKIVR